MRIPESLITKTGIEEEIEISVEGSRLVITLSRISRTGWNESFDKMAALGDDKLLGGCDAADRM